MDKYGNIYEDENVPAEDAARLDGYLKARAEADATKKEKAELEAMKAEFEAKIRAAEQEAKE